MPTSTKYVSRCCDVAAAFVKSNPKRIIENALSANEIHNFARIMFPCTETAHVDLRRVGCICFRCHRDELVMALRLREEFNFSNGRFRVICSTEISADSNTHDRIPRRYGCSKTPLPTHVRDCDYPGLRKHILPGDIRDPTEITINSIPIQQTMIRNTIESRNTPVPKGSCCNYLV